MLTVRPQPLRGSIRCLAWDANATDGLRCPFCRARPRSRTDIAGRITGKTSSTSACGWPLTYSLDCMRQTTSKTWMPSYDGHKISRHCQLCLDMPEEDKREAIRHTVECWLDMGDEEFSRHLAEMVYGQSTVGFTPPVARPTFRGRHVSSSSRLDGDRSSNGTHTN